MAEKPFNLNFCAYAGVNDGVGKKALPEKFVTHVLGHSSSGIDFVNSDIDQDLIGETGLAIPFINENHKSIEHFLATNKVLTGFMGLKRSCYNFRLGN